ncbi:hypothetical protein EYZ11_006152 [Aspergillus tanneri]|uniref:Uncharacterized protein n=1 Tax=Aspergillus tanneri TaxID=1220188 RepID=A0A4V3UPA5_9EURO|nr:hypothetical protein EYZ11_006152 [Aspergillus tanneri]
MAVGGPESCGWIGLKPPVERAAKWSIEDNQEEHNQLNSFK